MRPYGFENDRHTIREPEAELLRGVVASLLSGETLRAIATHLNESGARTTAGNPWQPNVLRRTLLTPRLAGKEQTRNGELRDADWPAIIEPETWEKVKTLLTDEARRTGGRVGPARTYLLTGGLARCGVCGKELIAQPEVGNKRGYACTSGPRTNGCGKIRINADLFENEVAERVIARLLRADSRQRIADAMARADEAAKEAPAKIDEGQKRLDDAARLYANGEISAKQLATITSATKQAIDEARRAMKLGQNLSKVAVLEAEDLVEWWEGATTEQKRSLIDTGISEIHVMPATKRGSKIFDPSRVEIVWRRD